jgi:hypothetical protein
MDMECWEGDSDIWIWILGRGMVIYAYGVLGGGWCYMYMECWEMNGDIWIWSAGRGIVIYGYGVLGGG